MAPAGEVGHIRVALAVHGWVEERELAVVPLVGDGAAGDGSRVAGLLVARAAGLREVLPVAAAALARVVLEDARPGDLSSVAGEGVVVGQGRGGVIGAVNIVVEEDGALVVAAGGGCDRGSGCGGLHNGGGLLDWGGHSWFRVDDGGLLGSLGCDGCHGGGRWRWGHDDWLGGRGWDWGWDWLRGAGALDEDALGEHRCDDLGDGWGHDRRGRGGGWDDAGAGLRAGLGLIGVLAC